MTEFLSSSDLILPINVTFFLFITIYTGDHRNLPCIPAHEQKMPGTLWQISSLVSIERPVTNLFFPNCPDCLIATSFTSILISSRPFGQSPGLFKCACRRVSPHLSRMNSFSSITTFSFRLSFRSTAYISYRFRRDRDHWGILYHYFSWRVLSPRNHPCWFPSPWPPAHALPSAPP